MGQIYKMVCRVDGGKVYVGQTTKPLSSRMAKHVHDTREGRNCAINQAISKYGIHSFSIAKIESCPNNKMDERETYWIAKLQSHDRKIGYNRTFGGKRGRLSDDVIEELSRMKSGPRNPMFGKRHTVAARARMSRTRKGRPAHNKGKSFPRKDNHLIKVGDITICLAEWSRKTGVCASLIGARLRAGWPAPQAVGLTPRVRT